MQLELGFKLDYEVINTDKYRFREGFIGDRYIKTIKFNESIFDIWVYPKDVELFRAFVMIACFGHSSSDEFAFMFNMTASKNNDYYKKKNEEHPELYEIIKSIAIEEGFLSNE